MKRLTGVAVKEVLDKSYDLESFYRNCAERVGLPSKQLDSFFNCIGMDITMSTGFKLLDIIKEYVFNQLKSLEVNKDVPDDMITLKAVITTMRMFKEHGPNVIQDPQDEEYLIIMEDDFSITRAQGMKLHKKHPEWFYEDEFEMLKDIDSSLN